MNSLESEASLLLSILLAAPQTLGWQRDMIVSAFRKVMNDRVEELVKEWENRLPHIFNIQAEAQIRTCIRELRRKLLG